MAEPSPLCPPPSFSSPTQASSSPFESRALKVPNPASDSNTLQGEQTSTPSRGGERARDEWQMMEGCETEGEGRQIERRGARENNRGLCGN